MQPHLWRFLALTFAGWVNRSQQDAIEYLKEENRVLREQLGARRLRFTDDQRRRLAAKAKALCRENLKEIAELVIKATLQHVLEGDDGRVIGIHHNSGERNGNRLDVGCCIDFEVKDGRIVSGREHFYDLYAWDKFWS